MESERLKEWRAFSKLVEGHIENYTVQQYGDKGVDQLTGWTPEQCYEAMQRYINRRNSNRRGDLEMLRDLVKIAHYGCVCFSKRFDMLPLGDIPALRYKKMIEEGHS